MTNVVKRSDELDERIAEAGDVDRSIDALIIASKRNRRLTNWVIVSIVFETLLTMAVIFTVVRTSQNKIRIEQTQNTLVNNCKIGNDFRASEASLWNYILSIPSDTAPSPEQDKKVASFKVFLDKTFAPRDCSKP